MKNRLSRAFAFILSAIMAFSLCVPALAADEPVPVIVVNDLDYNPLFDLTTNEIVFSFADLKKDLPMTHGLPSQFYEEFSFDQIEELVSGKMDALQIITFLGDGLGYTDDIATLVPTVL